MDDNGHVGRPCEVSLAPPCPELGTLLRVTGPLPSLVPRTEDMWQKLKTNVIGVCVRSSRTSERGVLLILGLRKSKSFAKAPTS